MSGQDEGQDSSVNPQSGRSLDERVSSLEQSVQALETTVRDLINALARRERVGAPPPPPPPSPSREARHAPRSNAAGYPRKSFPTAQSPGVQETTGVLREAFGSIKNKSAGFWLSRLGIGLLLLGVAFLFKYAVDEGWLTPHIRIAFGLALGVALAAIGIRVERTQRWFAPVMLGGAAATFYITGFAAFQFFELVGYTVAFVFMVAVTAYTLWAALHSDAPVLAVIGALGGLGTPFLLYTESGSVAGLVMYTCIVLLGTSGIYLNRGWLSLLWTTVLAGWAVLGVGLAQVATNTGSTTLTDQWALQVAALVALFVFWVVPVAREALIVKNPGAWHQPPRATLARMLGMPEDRILARSAQTLVLSVPIAVFFFARESWPYSDWIASVVAGALVVFLLAAWWQLGDGKIDTRIRSMHAVGASILVAIGLQYAFQNHTLLVTWAVEVLVLHFAARRLNERSLAFTAHVLFLIVLVWLGARFVDRPDVAAVLNPAALANALAVLAVVAASFQLSSESARRRYRLAAIFGFVGLCWSELGALPDGARYILVAWAAIGVGLLYIARRSGDRYYRYAGHLLYAATGYWLATRLTIEDPSGVAIANPRSVLHLAAFAGGVAGSALLEDTKRKSIYLLVAHVLLLAWMWQELSGLPGGHGFVSIAWGIYALLLLIVGLRRDASVLRKTALATFLAVVVKLFLVDLSELEPLWRILLFLGFGGLFLVLSYYFSRLWRDRGVPEHETGPTPS